MQLVSQFLEASHGRRQYSNFGPNAVALEEEARAHYAPGAQWSACTSATAGLTAALHALRVAGRVAVPAFTFPATHAAVRAAGLEPVTFDVEPASGILSAGEVRAAAAAGRIGAVVAVRPYGVWSDLAALSSACREHRLPLVIDNASGFGVGRDIVARYACDAAIEVFSLHATKPAGIGEGGLMMHPAAFRDDVRRALNFGMRPGTADVLGPGLNGKMDEMRAAMARAVLRDLPARVKRRQAMAARLGALAVGAEIEPFMPSGEEERSPWQCFPIRLPERSDPETVVAACAAVGLVVRRYYHPVVSSPAGAVETPPEAKRTSRRALCLPVYDGPEADQVDVMWARFLEALARSSRTVVAARST